MRAIHLVAVGSGATSLPGETVLEGEGAPAIRPALERIFHVPCIFEHGVMDASFAFDPARNQHHSTAILQRLALSGPADDVRTLGLTSLDLFVPVLTFVFGEAQREGHCALVSTHRLREEFYGLPPRPDLLRERVLKESVHELGHTFGLRHCLDWECVMASTHAVERLDLKSAAFCPSCRKVVEESVAAGR